MPNTAWTTSAIKFHKFLSIFFCFFTMIFWSPGMAMSMIKQLFAILSMHAISDRVCSITLRVWIGKSCKILHHSFTSTKTRAYSYMFEYVHYTLCILVGTSCIVANGHYLLLYHVFFGIASLPD